MKAIKYLSMAMLGIMGSSVFAAPTTSQMTALSDHELAAESGQALFNMSFIDVGGTNPNTDLGFYKVGIEAQVELNANIKRLQLGCGGFKGVGCDVDLENVSFTGIVPTREKPGGNDAGPKSDFTLINPFFEMAVKNPTNAATREVVGFRVGADSVWGMLSIGDPGSDPDKVSSHTGINSLSGHMPVYLDNGKIPVQLCIFGANSTNTACGVGKGSDLGFATITADSPDPGSNRFDLVLNRANRVFLKDIRVKASLLGIPLDLSSDLDQSLRFIHNITAGKDTNNNGKYDKGESSPNFGISVQGQNINWKTGGEWSKAGKESQKGWWLELPESKIGDFTTRRVYTGLDALTGLSLRDLNQNQSPVDNCYGGLTFC